MTLYSPRECGVITNICHVICVRVMKYDTGKCATVPMTLKLKAFQMMNNLHPKYSFSSEYFSNKTLLSETRLN